jgi:hypothetical protein
MNGTTRQKLAEYRREYLDSLFKNERLMANRDLLDNLRFQFVNSPDFTESLPAGTVPEDFMPAVEQPGIQPEHFKLKPPVAPAEATRVAPDLHKVTIDRHPFLFREATSWWPNWMKAAYSQSITGIVHNLVSGEAPFDLRKYEPGMVEDIAATVISFLMPLDIATFAAGGIAGRAITSGMKGRVIGKLVKSGVKKEVAVRAVNRASRRFLQRTAAGAIESGARLGAYSGTQAGLATVLTGEGFPDITESVKSALHGTALGVMLGAVGGVTAPLAKYGIPGRAGMVGAEIGTFAGGGAALEGRLPNIDDLARAAGIVIALKLEGVATKAAKQKIAEMIVERMTKEDMNLEEATMSVMQIQELNKKIPDYKFPIVGYPAKYFDKAYIERQKLREERPEIPRYEEDPQIAWMKEAKTGELIEELQRVWDYTDDQIVQLNRPEMEYILSGGRIGTRPPEDFPKEPEVEKPPEEVLPVEVEKPVEKPAEPEIEKPKAKLAEKRKYIKRFESGKTDFVEGYPIDLPFGYKGFIHKEEGEWVVSEVSSGAKLAGHSNKDEAIGIAHQLINQAGEKNFKDLVARKHKKFGEIPPDLTGIPIKEPEKLPEEKPPAVAELPPGKLAIPRGTRPAEIPAGKPAEEIPETPTNLVDHFRKIVKSGDIPKSPTKLITQARQFDSKLTAEKDNDYIYDSYEGALAREYHDRVKGIDDFDERLKIAQDIEKLLPTRRRTLEATSLARGQFSTPLPLAEGMYQAAKIDDKDIILEPTAGTGSLIAPLKDKHWQSTWVNEKEKRRADILSDLLYRSNAIVSDADFLNPQFRSEKYKPTVILMNPPWGSPKRSRVARIIEKPDMAASFFDKAMDLLEDRGRIVALLPTTMIPGENQFSYRWMSNLAKKYDIKAIIMSPDQAYHKGRGTDVGSFILVVDKISPAESEKFPLFLINDSYLKNPAHTTGLLVKLPTKIKSANEIYNVSRFENWQSAIDKIAERPDIISEGGVRVERPEPIPVTPRPAGEKPGRPPTGLGEGIPVTPAPSPRPGRPGTPGTPAGEAPPGRPVRETTPPPPEVVPPETTAPPPKEGVPEGPRPVPAGGPGISKPEPGRKGTVRGPIFTQYLPEHPDKSGNLHPRKVVVTKSSVSAGMPDISDVQLKKRTRRLNKRGIISDEQLDFVCRAEKALDAGHGFVHAHDVGVGKTRVLGAHITEWFESDKANRVLYVTSNPQNVRKVMKEFDSMYEGGFPYKMVDVGLEYADASQRRPGKELHIPKFPKSVYLIHSYNIVDFMPELKALEFDALIGDESHKFLNVKGSMRGAEWASLHVDLLNRNARILYSTATPARNIEELRYLYGIREWVPGEFDLWIRKKKGDKVTLSDKPQLGSYDTDIIKQQIRAGAVRKKRVGSEFSPKETEQIIRELVAKGKYLSADLLRDGVEFDISSKELTQVEKDKIRAGVNLLDEVRKAYNKFKKIDKTLPSRFGIESNLQFLVKTLYFHYRLDRAIEDAKKSIEKGEQPIIILNRVSGDEKNPGADLFEEDFDPRTNLPRWLSGAINRIPDTEAERDPDTGEIIKGDVVPEAVAEKQRLFEAAVEFWPKLDHPIQRVIDEIGIENVAPLVGTYSTREGRTINVSHNKRTRYTDEFQRGDKKCAVVSAAAKEGIDLHDVNHARRHVIVVDYEWTADLLKQSLGRADRTDQVSAPRVSILNFGTGAERRFVGTLANRIIDLGATSKGAAKSTGTEKMSIFEYGGPTHYETLRRIWEYGEGYGGIPDKYKDFFLHLREFRDPYGNPRHHLDEVDANVLQRFWRSFQTIPVEEGNEINDVYEKMYDDVNRQMIEEELASLKKRGVDIEPYKEDIDKGMDWVDIRKKRNESGEILRHGKLNDEITLYEVRAEDADHYGIVSGIITDNIFALKDFLPISDRTGRPRLKFIDFEAEDRTVSGLVIPTISKLRALAERYKTKGFGLRVSIENMPAALKAGERIPLANGWIVYLGRGGERAGKFIIKGPKMVDVVQEVGGQKRLKYGLKFHPSGFYYMDEEVALKAFVEKIGLETAIDISGAFEEETSESRIGRIGEMPVERESVPGPPVKLSEIKDYMEKEFGVPVRTGHIRKKMVGGVTKMPGREIRAKKWGDIETYSHEIGHVIDKDFPEITKLPGYKSELPRLDYDYPETQRASEGWAEYLRHWLTSSADPESLAPLFHESFEKFLNNQPDLKRKLEIVQGMIDRYRQEGAVDRIYGQIDFEEKGLKPGLKERIGSAGRRIGALFWDNLLPLEYVEKRLRGVQGADVLMKKYKSGEIDPASSPTAMARADAMTANSKAKEMVLWGTFDYAGNKTGMSLREAVAPVSKNEKMLKQFLAYLYARHAIDLHTGTGGRRKPKQPGISYGDALYVRDMFDSPEFRKAAKEVRLFEARVLDYLVEAGGIPRNVANYFLTLMPSYIPLKRVFESGEWIPTTGGKKYADLPQVVKRLKGSGRPIHNPLHSIIKTTAEIISIADKIRVGKALVELAQETPGGRKWVSKVPAPLKVTKVEIPEIIKQIERAGIDISESTMSQLLDVFANSQRYLTFFFADTRYRGKDNIVSFWLGAKRQFYELHPDLYGALKAMDSPNFGVMMKFLSAPARAVRLGATGLQAGFGLITNPIRDAFTFALQTEFSRGTPDLIGKALKRELFPEDKMHELFKRSGSDMAQFLGLDRFQLKKAIRSVQSSDAKQKALNVVGHPIEATSRIIEAMKDLFSFTEAAPRLAEFEAAYKKGEKMYGPETAGARLLGALSAQDVTINFRRMGHIGMVVNQIIPFWNAAVQGIHKFGRFAAAHPIKAGIKSVSYLTIPTIMLWIWHHDEPWYRELPDWQRYGYWNIPIGPYDEDGRPKEIVRIPRPFEWGWAYASAVEMALEYFNYKDPGMISDFVSEFAEQNAPFPPYMNPTVIEIPLELYANYDFFRDRMIDPYFEVEYKDPADRFSGYTTETAKAIGKTFGISPRKIEHLVERSSGGLGMDILRAIESVGKPSRIETGADIPVAGRLFTHQPEAERRRANIEYLRTRELQRIDRLYEAGKDKEAEEKIRVWNKRYPDFAI